VVGAALPCALEQSVRTKIRITLGGSGLVQFARVTLEVAQATVRYRTTFSIHSSRCRNCWPSYASCATRTGSTAKPRFGFQHCGPPAASITPPIASPADSRRPPSPALSTGSCTASCFPGTPPYSGRGRCHQSSAPAPSAPSSAPPHRRRALVEFIFSAAKRQLLCRAPGRCPLLGDGKCFCWVMPTLFARQFRQHFLGIRGLAEVGHLQSGFKLSLRVGSLSKLVIRGSQVVEAIGVMWILGDRISQVLNSSSVGT